LVAAGLLLVFALAQAAANRQPDFFIYRLGAELGLRGESPYDIGRIRSHVAEQFPAQAEGPDSFVNNCGYFLPPMAVLVYAPFAVLLWPAAKVGWAIVSAVAALAITRIPGLFREPNEGLTRPRSPVWDQIVPFLMIVNFLTLAIVQVGQSTILVVGCVAAGQWCFERKRPALGVLLWSVAFIKPHVALPLIALAWYLGGWKRAAALLIAVAVLNLLAATLIGGTPLFLREYLDFLGSGHKAVAFNLVERNYEITSWNRLLFVATGRVIEQTAILTVASYAVWFGLIAARCAWAGFAPSAAWAAAAAATGAVWCPQVLAYEALMLVFVVPWLRELFDRGESFKAGRWRRLHALAVALLLAAQLVPFEIAMKAGIDFHRPLAVALLAVLVLAGPIRPRP